jgi:putative SOS response-associated peptidase YedK
MEAEQGQAPDRLRRLPEESREDEMCGRYRLARDDKRIAEHFEIHDWREIKIPLRLPRFNVAPTQVVPAVRLDSEGRREVVGLRWGLVPHWAKESDAGYRTINARAETVAEKPSFREAFRRRRCLIPADGFYEWQPVGRKKQPWLVRLKTDDLFALAGLWEHWEGKGGEVLESFTVIVTDANDLLRPIHDRMPVILAPADYDAWLDVGRFDRTRLANLLRPYPAEALEAYPVSARVSNPRIDDESCAEPVTAALGE